MNGLFARMNTMELTLMTWSRARRFWLTAGRITLLEEGCGARPGPSSARLPVVAPPDWQVPAYQRRQRSGDTVWCAPRC
jgi:hypothetical protein